MLVLINGFFAAAELSVISMRRSRLKHLAEEKDGSAKVILHLIEDPSRFLATIQIGITMAGFLASAVGALSAVAILADIIRQIPLPLIADAATVIAVVVVTTTIAYFTLVFGELIPKTVGLQYNEKIALFVAGPIYWLSVLTSPFVIFLTGSTNVVLRLFGIKRKATLPSITEEEIISMIEAGEEEGVVEPEERKWIRGVFEFGETVVREVMVPRTDVVALEEKTSVDESSNVFLETGYSRIPVYREDIDEVVGILFVKDLFRVLVRKEEVEKIGQIIRPPFFVPESKKVADLFEELQRSRIQLAVVIDEYGGTAGIITLEDLVEEIFGDIRDEYDREEKPIQVLSPTEIIISAKASLDDLNEALDLEFHGEGFESVGGLILSELGRMPVSGDEVSVDGAVLTVLSVAGNRINKVKVLKKSEE